MGKKNKYKKEEDDKNPTQGDAGQQPNQGGRQQQPQQGGRSQQQQQQGQQSQQGGRPQQQQAQAGGRPQQQQQGGQQSQQGGRPQYQQGQSQGGGRPQQQQQGGQQSQQPWSKPGQPTQQGWGKPQQQSGQQQSPRTPQEPLSARSDPDTWSQSSRGSYQQRGSGDGGSYSHRGGGDSDRSGGRGGYSQRSGGDSDRSGGRGGYSQRSGGDSDRSGGRGGYSQRGDGYSQRGDGYSQRSGGDRGAGDNFRGGYSQRGGSSRGGYQQQSQYSAPASSGPIEILKTNAPEIKKRGTKGTPGKVETNYLQLNLEKMPNTAYHYDVTIDPDRPKKLIRPAFELFNEQQFPNIRLAFDGNKNAYSVKKLPEDKLNKDFEVTVEPGPRAKTFKITIKETMDPEVDLSSLKNYYKERVFDKPMRALQCLEVVLSSPCHSKGVRAGRSFYTKPDQTYDLDDGYELWFGLYQAAILGDIPFLNVDIAHKSFPKEMPLINYMRDVLRQDPSRGLDNRSQGQISQFLRGLNIIYSPPPAFNAPPKLYKVNEMKRPASELTFELDDKVKTTVANYFASKGCRLQYPNLPCLHVGSTVKTNYVPMEFCSIAPGQAIKGRDGQRQVQKMIRYAATTTDERKQKIMNLLRLFNHNIDLTIQQFGVGVDSKFIGVPIRVLDSPRIEYLKNDLISVRNGSWRMNDSTKFLLTSISKAVDGHSWCVIYPKNDRDISINKAMELGDLILKISNKLNMKLSQKYGKYDYSNIDMTMQQLKKDKINLVIVILPAFGPITYAKVKQTAEIKYGILTQCIKSQTVKMRCNPETICNIMLKVNAKLNGANHKINAQNEIALQKKRVMFLGADVTHPSPDQKNIPSVVGVAASHDEFGTRYNMQYRLQQPTNENIVDMEEICRHHLMVYKTYNNAFPDHIIYYRDGVSDGQFPIVKQHELKAIYAACSKLKFKVKLTCIIVVKRHHTRFFPGPGNGSGKFNNVDPGTVVDRIIVHPNETQFFMVSHQSIQGTAKPTRYNVIQDDADINIDDLQALTYNLCHLFPRCNRVVSYPAPAYLAHLVAFRGRVYTEGENIDVKNLSKEYERRLVHRDVMTGNPMYFV